MSLWLSSNTQRQQLSDRLTTAITTANTPEPRAVHSYRNRTNFFLSPGKVQPVATQSYIDVGQRSFGTHVVCPTCKLLYTVGEEEDEKEHPVYTTRTKGEDVLFQWDDFVSTTAGYTPTRDDNCHFARIRTLEGPAEAQWVIQKVAQSLMLTKEDLHP